VNERFDVIVAGGGPSGSAAAWQALQTGARVLVVDKAGFPRDKPCGDGLTARAVSYLQKMGLADEVATFHRINRVTVFSPSRWELSFPKRPGMPDHGHTVSRTVLDTMLLEHAAKAGAVVRQGAEVSEPIIDDSGRVTGVVLKGGEKVHADAVIAADGAYSPIKRALQIDSDYNGYSAIAIRSEMDANRADSDSFDIYLKFEFQGDQLPGYTRAHHRAERKYRRNQHHGAPCGVGACDQRSLEHAAAGKGKFPNPGAQGEGHKSFAVIEQTQAEQNHCQHQPERPPWPQAFTKKGHAKGRSAAQQFQDGKNRSHLRRLNGQAFADAL
jgi:hypothetical protein